jgi:hypothetical protein
MFKLTKKSEPATYYAYETDSTTWQKITNGYNLMFDAALQKLISLGCNDNETDDIILLRQFFKEIEETLM